MTMPKDMGVLVRAAFATGADTVHVGRRGAEYSAFVGSSRNVSDGHGRSTSVHASAHGIGATPEDALVDALGKLGASIEVTSSRQRCLEAARARRSFAAVDAIGPSTDPPSPEESPSA